MASQDAVLAPATLAARTAGQRYRLIANNWTQRLALNTARPAFSDETVRLAFAYALDRRRLARALTNGAFQLPTSALLPPNLRSGGRRQYPLTADLRAARRLMRGRHIHIVFAADTDEAAKLYEPQVAMTLRRELSAIGIRMTVVPLPQTLDPAHRNAVLAASDLAQIQRNQDDARDPVQYLLHLPYLTASDRARLTNIESLPAPQRASAAPAAAARLGREARYVAYADAATPELVSKRLGCTIDQPEYPGLDLAALCLAHR